MHMGGGRQEKNRMAMHQPPWLRKEILPKLTHRRGKHSVKGCDGGDHENGSPKHWGAANAEAAHRHDLQVQIAEIDAEFRKMLDRVSTETVEAFDEETATRLMNEKSRLQQQLGSIADAEQRRENAKSRLDDIYMILDGIKNRPMEYDDQIVRQLLECMVVDSKERITVIFKGGIEVVQPLTEWQRLTAAPTLKAQDFS